MTDITIPFNRPHLVGTENTYIGKVIDGRKYSGDGGFTRLCHQWFEDDYGAHKALLVHSCTAALEMAALLVDVGPGDEVIMPSYTFVSTANAFVLRGATPVFVDIRGDTLNIDESMIEGAITDRTKAIVAVHYAGVSCEMDTIMAVAEKYGIPVIEDAAQAILSRYRDGRRLGTIGHLGCFSFHETKNISSGEGGVILVNDERFAERAEIIREKGTNRSRFLRGQVDKYTWVDMGSSYLPGELTAAFLYAQLESSCEINQRRLEIWNMYNSGITIDTGKSCINKPFIPEGLSHNAHMYYLLLSNGGMRDSFISWMRSRGVECVFHYIPLHSSPAGKEYGRSCGELVVTDDISSRLVRLPLWPDLAADEIKYVVDSTNQFFLEVG